MWKLKDESVKKDDLAKLDKTAEEYRKKAEMHQEAARSMRKTFLETGIFFAIAMIGIIVIAVAWFVTNNQVGAESSNVAANSAEQYLIASAGTRQKIEQEKYKENGMNILTDTDGEEYSGYYDILTGENVTLRDDNKLTLYKGSAWHLQDNGTMKPGANGVLEFYVIPQVEGLKQLTFTLNTVGYMATTDDNNPITLVEDSVVNELLEGHILFFTNFDDVNGYRGWLGTGEKKISVKAKSGDLQKDLPYKVSIYWIWPRRYRNFIYHQQATYGDLFSGESEDYTSLITFINGNKTKFFYNNGDVVDDIETKIDMDDSDYTLGTSYYNIADEYIGKNVNYIYLEIKP